MKEMFANILIGNVILVYDFYTTENFTISFFSNHLNKIISVNDCVFFEILLINKL